MYEYMKTLKHVVVYGICILLMFGVGVFSHEIYSTIIQNINPCTLLNPSDFDCLDLKNIFIPMILSV